MFKIIKLFITLAVCAIFGYAVWFNLSVPQPARPDDRYAYTRDTLILKGYAYKHNKSFKGKPAPEDVLTLADQGNLAAQIEAAQLLFDKAKTDDKQYAKAVDYLHKAAEHGVPAAQNAYGVASLKGLGGLNPDKLEAYKWFNLAAGRGMDIAGANMVELAREINITDIADAEHRTSEWLRDYLAKQ